MDHFFSPHTLQEALSIFQQTNAVPIAGGTDLLPRRKNLFPEIHALVDLTKIAELNYIREKRDYIEIGACTNFTHMLQSSLLNETTPALIQACSQIGSVQTRNRGTLGGNVANASPAGDTLPPLLIHNAQIALISAHSKRLIPLNEFLIGPGKTKRKPEEIIHHVRVEKLPEQMRSFFIRLGNRQGMAISIASLALGLLPPSDADQTAQKARLALGAVAPTPLRIPSTELLLTKEPLSEKTIQHAAQDAAAHCSPIADVRASLLYRQNAVKNLVVRAFAEIKELV